MKRNPINDKEFLYELSQFRQKEIYAKIIALDFEENPLEQIEGKVTGGSLNIDGSSAVRRTCNLSLVAKDVNISDFYWSVSNKFTLEIGVKNQINKEYPEIIWFSQGIYVITSFNVSLANNSYNISISGKDKMCLLNGDIGGNLYASIDFGKIDTYSDAYSVVEFEDLTQYVANKYYVYQGGEYIISTSEYDPAQVYYTKDVVLEQEDLKLKDIIREAVHVYGKEMYHNIIINDLDDYGLELLEYRGENPLYMLYNEDSAVYENMVLDEDFPIYIETSPEKYKYEPIEDLSMEAFYANPEEYWVKSEESKDFYYQVSRYNEELTYYTRSYIAPTVNSKSKQIKDIPVFNNAINDFNDSRTIFYLNPDILDENTERRNEARWSATKIEAGNAAGYRTTDLTYAGELISSIGESLTSILDKIKNMLGPFEYFYDKEGHFVFQAKKIYANESWNSLVKADDEVFARDSIEESPYSYSFEDVNLIQQFQNAPAINQIKNDYSIWGVRKGVSGAEIPIHARYAIHEKPIYYRGYDGLVYCQNKDFVDHYFEQKKEELKATINDRLDNFKPQYPVIEGLKRPEKLPDGSWSEGWWDIRDWHDYYVALTNKEPSYSMKEYSTNNISGCIPYIEAFPNDSPYYDDNYRDEYVWLIIYEPEDNTINLQHGYGNPTSIGSWCFRYQSEYKEDGSLSTYWVDTAGNKHDRYNDYLSTYGYDNNSSDMAREAIAAKNNIPVEGVTWFIPPFDGCNDRHTYLEFLEGDIKKFGNLVYFYNPNFPGTSSLQEAIDKEIQEEYEKIISSYTFVEVDWREIIYQMAKDYFKHNQDEDFLLRIRENNMMLDGVSSYYPTGETGYEMFYTDMQGFWRQLYDPDPEIKYDTKGGYYTEEKEYEADGITYKIVNTWNPFEELDTFSCDYFLKPSEGQIADEKDYSSTKYYWNKNVVNAPDLLNFWIDFYEGDAPLSQYSIGSIGDRPKVVNNNKVSSIYFRNIPQIIFYEDGKYDPLNIRSGYTYANLVDMGDLFTISSQGKSAQDELNELFDTHAYCTETVTITSVPIYYLEPNTLVYIHNEESGINGKFQLTRLSIPLTYNGMMSINATKIKDKIYLGG